MLTAEPKGYGSNWYATTRVDSSVRPRLSMELDVEVCVIGAGIAGLTVACEVARRGWSVVVLEAKSIAWSASGRNSGVVLPGFGIGVDALIERVGLDSAKALWAMSEHGAAYVRRVATIMPGASLSEDGWLHVSKTDHPGALAHEAALLAGEFGVMVEPWPADRVREALNAPRYFHGLHYPRGFSLHPLNYALGLADAAEALGARIFEDTPALEIDPAGVRKRIVTGESRIRAAHVVLAGGVHLGELAPQFTDTLLPVYDTVVVTAPLGDELAETIRYPGAVSDEIDPAGHHYRVIDGERLMWCGRSSVQPGNPHRQGEALLRQIRHTYPTLSGVKVEHAWVGVSGHTVHGMPQIGEITPGLWLLNGFGGHGINTATMGGELVARAIVDNERAVEMFAPFPLVWAGGAFGRIAQQVSGWSRQLQDAVGGMLAKRRGAARARPDAALAPQAAAAALPDTMAEVPVAVAEREPPLAQPQFAEPVEPPVVVHEFTEPAQAPVPLPEFLEPVRPPVANPAIVDRIRALVTGPETAATEAPSADVAAPVIPRRPKRGPKRRKTPLLLQQSAPHSTGDGSGPADAPAPLDPSLADKKI